MRSICDAGGVRQPQVIDGMAREKLAHVFRDLTTRPALLGFFVGLVLAFVVRKLVQDDNALGFVGIPILILMSFVWVRKPLYKMIFVALFVGTFLGLLLVCREECQSRWNRSLLPNSGRGAIEFIKERFKP